jgi:hypothetical protein
MAGRLAGPVATYARPRRRRTAYLDDADDLLLKHQTAHGFFNAMLERYPNRLLGATILWAGAQALYAIRDGHDAISAVVGGWLH